MDIKSRIENLNQSIRKAEQANAAAGAQKDVAQKEMDKLAAEMAELGVTPDTITDKIQSLGTEVEELLSKAEKLIPQSI